MRALWALLLIGLVGCKYGSEFEVPRPSTSRLPNVSDRPYVHRVNELGFAVLAQVDAEGPVVFSPYALANSLAMLMGGANNVTRDQILLAFSLTESNKGKFNESQRALLNAFNAAEPRAFRSGSAVFSVWPVLFDEGYVSNMARTFEGSVRKLGGATIEGKRLLDQWASERTGGAVTQFDLELDKRQQLLALSVASFEAGVDEKLLRRAGTATVGEIQVRVKSTPLKGGKSLVEVAPVEASALMSLLQALDRETWNGLTASLAESSEMNAGRPLELQTNLDLQGALEAVGIGSVFDGSCNLRPMSIELESGMSVSRFLQQVRIKIGTGPSKPSVYAVVDEATGVLLMLGVAR